MSGKVASRIARLEETHGAGDCPMCHGERPYYPDAVNTKNRYYVHTPCPKCGRPFTITVELITSRSEVRDVSETCG